MDLLLVGRDDILLSILSQNEFYVNGQVNIGSTASTLCS